MKLKTTLIIVAAAAAGGYWVLGGAQASINGARAIGTYSTGAFDEGAAEIVDYDPKTKQLFVVNGDAKTVDILDISEPSEPKKVAEISAANHGKAANSVSIHKDLVALAIQADDKTQPGKVAIYKTSGEFVKDFTVGALPDMVIFSPDGKYVLAACEGEPNDDYTVDPEGTVAVIDISNGVDKGTVKIADFKKWNSSGAPRGARIVKPGATAAQDFEPEYIAVSPDSKTAWVTLQENNAVGVIDIAAGQITNVVGLGFKDHSKIPLDASNKDDKINLATWPVLGMYQPDTIVAFEVGGETYLAVANEGDAKDYDGWSEEARVKDLTLDAEAFPNAAELQDNANLGRLKTTTSLGDTDGDGDHDQIYAYGGRSFSIWNAAGEMIFDSGDEIERILSESFPNEFNSTNDENGSFDNRSDDKGPEPEALEIGKMGDKTYAFVGLERMGGFMIYDVSNPAAPSFVDYVTTRNFEGDPAAGTAGDLAPEGLKFISKSDSPNGKALLAVANEVSGTTTLFELTSD